MKKYEWLLSNSETVFKSISYVLSNSRMVFTYNGCKSVYNNEPIIDVYIETKGYDSLGCLNWTIAAYDRLTVSQQGVISSDCSSTALCLSTFDRDLAIDYLNKEESEK